MSTPSILYIGSRSKLLSSCKDLLPSGEVISLSHAYKLHDANMLKSFILVLFSLPPTLDTLDTYIKFIRSVDCYYLFNVSSTCIYAFPFYLRANYIPFYFQTKYRAHIEVSNRDFCSNIILGTFNNSPLLSHYPLSSVPLFASTISNSICDVERSRICEKNILCFRLRQDLEPPILYHFRTLYFLLASHNIIVVQALDMLAKAIGFPLRNYTCLSGFFFPHTLRIGDGAFGAAISDTRDFVLRSNLPDKVLSPTHLGTLQGLSRLGLDRIRHGIEIVKTSDGFRKKWNPSLRLRNPFRMVFNDPVISIAWLERASCFKVVTRESFVFYCQRIKLAAGTLENIRLCLDLLPKSIRSQHLKNLKVSDHFILKAGSISIEDAIVNNLVSKHAFGSILIRKQICVLEVDDNPIGFIEIRLPSSQYLSQAFSEFFSFLFNRTGIGFAARYLDVYAQLLVSDSILFDPQSSQVALQEDPALCERRLTLARICQKKISFLAPSFRPISPVILPSHHLHGGSSLLSSDLISFLVASNRLTIAGSPSLEKLGPFHHTLRICRSLRSLRRN